MSSATRQISNLAGVLIQRDTALHCARSAKRDGNLKDVRHFVRCARCWHAKALHLMTAMAIPDVAVVSRWVAITQLIEAERA